MAVQKKYLTEADQGRGRADLYLSPGAARDEIDETADASHQYDVTEESS